MMSLFITMATYGLFLVSVPLVASSTCIRTCLIPKILYKVPIYHLTANSTVICVGFATAYIYCILGFIIDLFESTCSFSPFGSPRVNASRTLGPVGFTTRLSLAQKELTRLFPGYAICSLLIWANTNQYDTLRDGFLFLQTIFLILLPWGLSCQSQAIQKSFQIAFRCCLFWGLLYAVMPRDTNYHIVELTRLLKHYRAVSHRSLGDAYLI
ncbi:hypothetical protein J3Q64DRAFT_1043959 [Phycomyces blakesleeanus]|uniref:Uncharacterized protein n=2 Tax=Phycomyces blakesleeanus TaxID=4837 RepID=A0A167KQ18_PHYB8|nr:hypothetical protein PHYBLDRAFT_173038 [Phycomyces blakesleeanus NRRL 1555(-)]OAD68617.1 hypothetical protein PHYBLDRAFT_173038 [Phycomyces blakesleeanus NRRL 1555(-)]|eukprot:XP_018286657.1 hypothetical protein PHYBLDRAFT_173038 [Phycomyces blakesleeanus NRRL 1555(-)]